MVVVLNFLSYTGTPARAAGGTRDRDVRGSTQPHCDRSTKVILISLFGLSVMEG